MKTVYIKRNDLFKNIQMILLNNINEIDESFIEDNMNLFEYDCPECNGQGEKDGVKCDNCFGDGTFTREMYLSFITDLTANSWEMEALKAYGVPVGYSNLLDKYILPIYDFGTSWSCFSYSKQVEDDYTLGFNETSTRTTVY